MIDPDRGMCSLVGATEVFQKPYSEIDDHMMDCMKYYYLSIDPAHLKPTLKQRVIKRIQGMFRNK